MRKEYVKYLLILLLIAISDYAVAQEKSNISKQLKDLVEKNDQLFLKLQNQGNDTTGFGTMVDQLSQYYFWLKAEETREIVEENSNVEVMLARVATFYQMTRNSKFDEFHSFFEEYYKEQDEDNYLWYCGINEQYYMYLFFHQRFFTASEVAMAINKEIESAGDTSLINSVAKYYIANAYAMQNIVTKTEQWLNASYEVGKGKAESCENEFLVQRYGDMLVTRARLFAIQGKYDRAEDSLDEMLNLVLKRHGKNTLFYANGLLLKADLLALQARWGDLKKVCEEVAPIISDLTGVEPVVKDNMQTALKNYQARISSNTTENKDVPIMPGSNEQLVVLGNQVNDAAQKSDWKKVLEAGKEWMAVAESLEMINFKEYDMMVHFVTQSYLALGLYTEASHFLDHSQAFVKQRNVFDSQADRFIILKKGRLYTALGNMQLAKKYFNESKSMYDKVGDRSLFYIQCLSEMIDFFFMTNDWAYTKLFCDELNKIINENTRGLNDLDQSKIGALYYKNAIASYMLMMGYNLQAIDELKKMLIYFDSIHDDANWFAAFFRLMAGYVKTQNMGGVYALMDEIDKHNLPLKEKRHLKMAYGMISRDPSAIDVLEQYNLDARSEIEKVRASFSPYEQESFWESRVRWLNWYNYMLACRIPDNPRATQYAYDNALYVRRPDLDKPALRWHEIRNLLDEHDVAIEMINTSDFNEKGEDKFIYAALILRKDYDAPKFVSLCDTDSLSLIWQDVIHTDTALINSQYSASNSDVYNMVWGPLSPFLKDSDNIYYVPTGYIGRFNIAAISENGAQLSKRYKLHQLSTTAEISRIKTSKKVVYHDAAIYGGITYDESDDEMLSAAATYKSNKDDNNLMAFRSSDRGANFGQLQPLPGTGEEAREIHKLLKNKEIASRLYDGSKANEESIKALSGHSPDIIHVGTHGFLLNTTSDIMNHQSFLDNVTIDHSRQASSLNYSGLMFAGAEKVWSGEEPIEGIEDGILTSLELSQLDLSNTKLVVLSACETALGHTDENLGDYGLKRALKQAGVGTVIVSLWEVPDEPTKLLMTNFFRHIADGVECHEALSIAQDIVREKYPQPYYWASFVIID